MPRIVAAALQATAPDRGRASSAGDRPSDAEELVLQARQTSRCGARASPPPAARRQAGRTLPYVRCLPSMLDLTRSTMRRAAQVRLPQVAAGLTLTIALSIAPLVAVSFALFRHVPVFRPLE